MIAGIRGNIARISGILSIAVFLLTAGLTVTGIFSAAQYPWNKIAQASELIASRSGWSIYAVKGCVILASTLYFFAWSKLLPNSLEAVIGFVKPATDPLKLFRNRWGLIIVGYMSMFYFVLAFVSQDASAYKNCAETPGGLIMTDNTGIDPKYGQPLVQCTPEQIERANHPDAPRELSIAAVNERGFFSISGYARVWYAKDHHGYYRFYDRRGVSGEGYNLEPVTREVVADWHRKQERAAAQREEDRIRQDEAAKQARQQEALTADSARAQQQYQSGDWEGSLQSCKSVLQAKPSDDDCGQVQHDAGAKLAQRLVTRAQAELQRGEMVDAARDAERASKLDPKNGDAKNIRTLALGLPVSGNQ